MKWAATLATRTPSCCAARSCRAWKCPRHLLAVARAGAGVNNVPVADYSKQGIVVFNTPGANANAVKELVMAGMLLATRGILPGLAYVQSLTQHDAMRPRCRALLEKEKSRFAGGEIKGKTLGIVGPGRHWLDGGRHGAGHGHEGGGVRPGARRSTPPGACPTRSRRMENLQSLLARSDYVSLHVPAMDATRHLINDDALASVKKGAVLLNFARETIVDPAAVLR